MIRFNPEILKNLYTPSPDSSKNQNGIVTIIGGSRLFHGAPLLALKTASRIVDMVFFATPEPSIGRVAEQIKSQLFSFIWVPWPETEEYLQKSDAILIGPGLMRFRSEKNPLKDYQVSRKITQKFLLKFPEKKWVIDAGSLQVVEPEWIPKNAIITPNQKEFNLLFGNADPQEAARKFNCILVLKGPTTFVYAKEKCVEIKGGNAGLTKGGTGDVQAGLTVALLAKNEPFLAACASAYLIKKAAEKLSQSRGTWFNADDLGEKIPQLYFPQKLR